METENGKQPGGDRGTDIGSHDDADGLDQRQHAGIDKSDRDDGGCTGRLQQRRVTHSKSDLFGRAVGNEFREPAQHGAGRFLGSGSQDSHAVQEQTQCAE